MHKHVNDKNMSKLFLSCCKIENCHKLLGIKCPFAKAEHQRHTNVNVNICDETWIRTEMPKRSRDDCVTVTAEFAPKEKQKNASAVGMPTKSLDFHKYMHELL